MKWASRFLQLFAAAVLRSIPNILAEEEDEETRLTLVARTVREVMAADPITIAPEETIQDAADLMLEYQVSGLPLNSC